MFSSKNFIVSSLTFRSLTYFEFIFVYGVRECCSFILLHAVVQFSQHHLLMGLFFFIVYSCLLCHRFCDYRSDSLSPNFLSCSIDLYFCFCASTMLF